MSKLKLKDLSKSILLGGLGTGCLKWNEDASNKFSGLVKTSLQENADKTPDNENPVLLAIGVKRESGRFSSAIIGNPGKDRKKPKIRTENFEKQLSSAQMNFSGRILNDIDLKLNVFNPTIVHNPIDSGIPAVFFEFDVTNNGEAPVLVSLCMGLRSFFSQGKASFGYDNLSGASYAMLSEVSKSVYARRRGSICVATDFPDFTYDSAPEIDEKNFLEHFNKKRGFLSDNTDVKEIGNQRNISALLSCHAKIKPGCTQKIRMVAAWCFPYCGDGLMKRSEKNYYFHYFPDAINCLSYCFTHFDRLKRENELTTKLINTSGMPQSARNAIMNLGDAVKNPNIRRDSKGVLRGLEQAGTEKILSPVSFEFEYLFPGITVPTNATVLSKLIKAGGKRTATGEFEPSAYDTDCTTSQIYARLMLIIRLYRGYRTNSDLKFFSENWVDIAYMADMLCRTAMHIGESFGSKGDGGIYVKMFSAVLCVLKIMTEVSDILADKKRKIYYLELYGCARRFFEEFLDGYAGDISSHILSTRYLCEYLCDISLYSEETIKDAANKVSSGLMYNDFYTYSGLVECGYLGSAEELLESYLNKEYTDENKLYSAAAESFVMLCAHSGFEYDKNTMSVRFCPDERFCNSDKVFKSFISFDGAYGYVEQGFDYIEIVLISGEIKVKKFTCSHRPYKAMYGGRIWSCDIKGNTVTMDSNLVVSKNKKLTLLIDITK